MANFSSTLPAALSLFPNRHWALFASLSRAVAKRPNPVAVAAARRATFLFDSSAVALAALDDAHLLD